jgi:tyrosinase
MFYPRSASFSGRLLLLACAVWLSYPAAQGEITINKAYPIVSQTGAVSLSAPTVVPTGQCSERVKITSIVPGATVHVYLVATKSGAVSPKKLIGGPIALPVNGMTVNLTQALNYGDQVEATQTVNGSTSGLSLPMTAGAMLTSLPEPTVDGKNIFACGSIVPVYNLESGVNVQVFDKNVSTTSPIGTDKTPDDWGSNWDPVFTSSLVKPHEIQASQTACNGAKSGLGPTQPVQPAPSPVPEPKVVNAIKGNNTVTLSGLFTGAGVQIFNGTISTPLSGVSFATGSSNWVGLTAPLTATDKVLPQQTLCQPSTGHQTWPTTNTIPKPVLVGPICPGSASVTVRNTTVNAALVLLINGKVAGYGGAELGDVTLNIAAPAVFGPGDMVQIAEYFTNAGSPPPALSNTVPVGCIVHVRHDVANLTAAQLASISRGFQVMIQRSFNNPNDPTGLTYQANMHSTLMSSNMCPMGDPTNPMWDQCQHYSDLFFPWHRMYLYYFERILRAASGDPNLTLPYWNYESPTEQKLPAAYTTPNSACSQVTGDAISGFVYQIGNPSAHPGCNPLYLPKRILTASTSLPSGAADDSVAMADTSFEPSAGGNFGGGPPPGSPPAECHFDGAAQGDLESQPHDTIHVKVGGIMVETTQSANDPVFFLHHTEIDHLWKRWLAEGGARANPTSDTAWMNSTFTFYDETGNVVSLSAQDVLDTVTQLDYRYDDDPAVKGQSKRAEEPREQSTQPSAPAPVETLPTTAPKAVGLDTVNAKESIELPADTSVKIRQGLLDQRRILLTLQVDHVKSSGGVTYEVYANLPDGQTPARESIYFVGNLAFFTAWDGSVTKSLDLTKTIRALQAKDAWKDNQLTLTFVPRGVVNAQTNKPLPLEPGVRAVVEEVRLGAR